MFYAGVVGSTKERTSLINAEIRSSHAVDNVNISEKEVCEMYKEHFNALLAAWNEGNLDGLDKYVASNVIRRVPASLNNNANNLAELKKGITDFRTAYPDMKVTFDELIFHEERSIARWTFTGTNTGPGNFPPTGKSVKVSGAGIGRFENGKLVEDLVYFDALEYFTQLGIIELPAAAASG